MPDKAEEALNSISIYLVYLKHHQPQKFFSTIDFIDIYLRQLKDRAKEGDWWNPIMFKDEEGLIVATYIAQEVVAVIRGNVQVGPEAK